MRRMRLLSMALASASYEIVRDSTWMRWFDKATKGVPRASSTYVVDRDVVQHGPDTRLKWPVQLRGRGRACSGKLHARLGISQPAFGRRRRAVSADGMPRMAEKRGLSRWALVAWGLSAGLAGLPMRWVSG